MTPELREYFKQSARELSLDISDAYLDSASTYIGEYLKWNKKVNLSTITAEKEIIVKHFIDSLALCPYIPKDSFVLDLGAGAGFPGLAVKLYMPGIRLILLDSSEKKISFLRHIIRTLKLTNVTALLQRADEAEFQSGLNGLVDVILARAFGSLEHIAKVGANYTKDTGIIIAMKGKDSDKELEIARGNLLELGLKAEEIHKFNLPDAMGARTFIKVSKS
jgi:16S rRNA (guanine527-N7)-methyltransferase